MNEKLLHKLYEKKCDGYTLYFYGITNTYFVPKYDVNDSIKYRDYYESPTAKNMRNILFTSFEDLGDQIVVDISFKKKFDLSSRH